MACTNHTNKAIALSCTNAGYADTGSTHANDSAGSRPDAHNGNANKRLSDVLQQTS